MENLTINEATDLLRLTIENSIEKKHTKIINQNNLSLELINKDHKGVYKYGIKVNYKSILAGTKSLIKRIETLEIERDRYRTQRNKLMEDMRKNNE